MSQLSCYVANRYPCVFCFDIAPNQGGQDLAAFFGPNLLVNPASLSKLPSTSKWDLVGNNTEASRIVICESNGKEIKLNRDIQNWRYDITSALCARDCNSWLYNNLLAQDISDGPPLPFTTLDVSNAACKFFVSTWDRTDLVCLTMAAVRAQLGSGSVTVATLLTTISNALNEANPCSCAGYVAGAGQIVPSGFGVDGEAASSTPTSGWTIDMFNGPYVALCSGSNCPTPTVVGGCASSINRGTPVSFDQLSIQQFEELLSSAGIPEGCTIEFPAVGDFGTKPNSSGLVDPDGNPLVDWNTDFLGTNAAPTITAPTNGTCLVIPTAQGVGVWNGDAQSNQWGFNSFLAY